MSSWSPRALVRRIRHRVALHRDIVGFRRRYGFLAQAKALETPGRRALLISLSNWVVQVKMEAMLATALRLTGWSPAILTKPACAEAQRYFRVCGLDRLVPFDEGGAYASAGGRSAEEVAEELWTAAPHFNEMLDLRYRGVYVGRHVLSSVLRTHRCGRSELERPEMIRRIRDSLVDSIRAVHAAERVLDAVQPTLVLFFEKGYSPYGELFDVAVNRGINTVQWVHAHRTDAIALKRYDAANRHQHPFSLSDASWQAILQMPWDAAREQEVLRDLQGRYEEGSWYRRKFLQVNKRIKPAEDVRRQLGLGPGKKTAVIFSHVLWDATFFFGDNLFDDYEEWLIETVRAACANPSLNWVVKIHPDYVWKLKALGGGEIRDLVALDARLGRLPDHVKLMAPGTDISTFSLFGVTDYAITVRGTIGIEMPCFGIPVITAGTGRYTGLGFTLDSSSRQEYLQRLRHLQDTPPLSPEQIERARRHAYALLSLRPLVFSTFEMVQSPLERLGDPLDHNVVIRARSFRDVERAADLRAFARWAGADTSADYLNPLVDGRPDQDQHAASVELPAGIV